MWKVSESGDDSIFAARADAARTFKTNQFDLILELACLL